MSYGVIRNLDYKPEPGEEPISPSEEVKQEESEEDRTPIDIEKYTEEEEKIREDKLNKNKNQNQWSKLEQRWGNDSNEGGSRKTSEDWLNIMGSQQ